MKAWRCARSSRCFRRNEALDLAVEAELGAFALEQRLERSERFSILPHALVDFHVRRRVVAPAHPAAANAELLFDQGKKRPHRRADVALPVRGDLVVDVIIQTGITASASPAALSTITPPWNSSPGFT